MQNSERCRERWKEGYVLAMGEEYAAGLKIKEKKKEISPWRRTRTLKGGGGNEHAPFH